MPLYLYDDARARRFEPFALTRPVAELCAGAMITRHRWARLFGEPAVGIVTSDFLRDFVELDAPPAAVGAIPAGAVIANSRCMPTARQAPPGEAWICGGRIAAVRLRGPLDPTALEGGATPLEALATGTGRTEIPGRWVDEVWDYIRHLSAQLADDIPVVAAELDLRPTVDLTPGAAVIGHHPVYIERGGVVEPLVVLDVRAGPILVRRGATVHAFTRVVGPCAIGEHSTVVADRIAASSIGDWCKVHGELSMSIVLGHANKSHDGFVGHSYLGRWVNLGAGTVTSNLKNTYGPVQLWTPDGMRDTGLVFLGSFIGDYARTGIGTRLTTGTVVGAGANIYPTGFAPKVVPPFAWGDGEPFDTFGAAKFLQVAERQMARRDVALGEAGRRYLLGVHERAVRRRTDPGAD